MEGKKRVSINQLYNLWAEDYDNNNLLMFLEEQITRKLFNFNGKRILDLGCGTGRYSIPLARNNYVTGVDFNRKMLDIARKKAKKEKARINFIQKDVTKFKTKDKFDVIISMLVHDQVKILEKAGKVIFSTSKKGTDLFVSNVHPDIIGDMVKKGRSEILPGYLIQEYYHPLSEYQKIFGKLGFRLIKSMEIVFGKKYFDKIEAPTKLRGRALGIIYHFRRER
jgi:ubiquinone/menaquinone biosynthesis C-methylase UbiE